MERALACWRVGLGVQQRSIALIIVLIVAAICLWVLEAIWKAFQYCYTDRISSEHADIEIAAADLDPRLCSDRGRNSSEAPSPTRAAESAV